MNGRTASFYIEMGVTCSSSFQDRNYRKGIRLCVNSNVFVNGTASALRLFLLLP